MNLERILFGFLNETSIEIKKEKNIRISNVDIVDQKLSKIINPVVKEVIDELSPYILKLIVSAISIVIIMIITIILNIKVILKN